MIRKVRWVVSLGALVFSPLAVAEQACYGPGDINRDGVVGLADHALVVGCLGGVDVTVPPQGCDQGDFGRADLDMDSDVDMIDFTLFSIGFAEAYFDYGPERQNAEAEMLAMAASGELRAPDVEYDRILRDLALIRVAYPELITVIDDPDYVRNELIVSVPKGPPTEAYEALNRFFLVTDVDPLFGSWYVLTFCDNLNAPVLALEYAALPEVQYAEPNYMIGIDDYITVTPIGEVYHYSIDDGFLDCFDGCDCHRLWELEVDDAGTVTLISYQETGMPWCEF